MESDVNELRQVLVSFACIVILFLFASAICTMECASY